MARMLCIGDVHLGRRPSRLPDRLGEWVDTGTLGPAAAWRRAVDLAVGEGVDAVLLAGDLVEQEDDFYEAYVDLQAGVERLTGAGVAVLGVAGNHDVKVLPRLAEAVPEFKLLGRGGQWESAEITAGNGSGVGVVGWSFPESRYSASPVDHGLPEAQPGPQVGLLHCDCDQRDSCYAPVRSADLAGAGYDAWALGHIHRPGRVGGDGSIVYLGSLTALDPGEPGVHGAWLLDIDAAGPTWRQVPLAPLRWVEIEVPLDGLEAAGDVHSEIVRALDASARALEEADFLLAVGCRLRLTGRTSLRGELERLFQADDPRSLIHERNGVIYFVHDWLLEASPAVDLDELARQEDPVGILARKILLLRRSDAGEGRELLLAARARLESVQNNRYFAALPERGLSDEALRDILERSAFDALDRLLAQREARD